MNQHPHSPARRPSASTRLTTGRADCLLAVALLAQLGGCASGPQRNPADPLEPLNRATYRFNDAIDRNLAQPVARGYNRAVPRPLRTGVNNFFSNLGDVTVMFNDFAQLRIMDGMNDLTRVAVNTSFGLLGILDIATPAGIPKHDQDFGLTLGRYGVPAGPYLVLPLFGPSSFRDAAGFGVDQVAAPANRMDPAWRNSLWGLDFVSTRARYLNATSLLDAAALDKYLFVRDAYLGRRRAQLTDKRDETPPDYGKEGGSAKEDGVGGGGSGGGGGGVGDNDSANGKSSGADQPRTSGKVPPER